MARIPEETLQAIRDRVDLVELVGHHVSLKKAGRDFKGLCPFHQEKTPSFHVVPHKQIFYCFGCGVGGSAIDFLMRQESLTFPEAARSLARQLGIPVPETHSGEAGLSERLHAANAHAQEFFRACLDAPEGKDARGYLAGRGFDAGESARFGIGFAPNGWEVLAKTLRKHGVPEAVAVKAGLVAERKGGGVYDRLRGRITFPIQDARGRVLGFGGRALASDQEPKYLNTPESPIFHKRQALYGLPDALEGIRTQECAVLVEGYFDRIALARAGVSGSLATCGTSLTRDHAVALRRRTGEVVLLFDGDAAGQRAVARSLDTLLELGLRVRVGLLPAGADPDSLLHEHGAEALRACALNAEPALSVLIRRAADAGVEGPFEKADAVASVVPLLARVDSPVERSHFTQELARATGAKLEAVEAAVRASSRGDDAKAEDLVALAVPQRLGLEERHLRGLAALLLDHPELLLRLDREELLQLVPVGLWKTLFTRLFGTFESRGSLDVDRICEGLEGEERAQIFALCAEERIALDEEQAHHALVEIVDSLRRRRLAERSRDLTRQFRDPNADTGALLRAKQQQLEERRRLQRVDRTAPSSR